jgi:hypothetical protein
LPAFSARCQRRPAATGRLKFGKGLAKSGWLYLSVCFKLSSINNDVCHRPAAVFFRSAARKWQIIFYNNVKLTGSIACKKQIRLP